MRLASIIIFIFLFLIGALLYSLFLSESGIKERNLILENNKILFEENKKLIDDNEILSENIKQAHEDTNAHTENIARERFNLIMPDEDFIVFEEEDDND